MITFNEWYKEYPRKKSRGDAEKAFNQALKAGHDPEDILEGLRRNLASMLRRDAQFIPYPASWLRAQGWWDEPDPEPVNKVATKRTAADAAKDFDARYGNRQVPGGLPVTVRD